MEQRYSSEKVTAFQIYPPLAGQAFVRVLLSGKEGHRLLIV